MQNFKNTDKFKTTVGRQDSRTGMSFKTKVGRENFTF